MLSKLEEKLQKMFEHCMCALI